MKLIVSLHDVAPPFEPEIRRQICMLRSIGVDRVVLKVVPNWHGAHPLPAAPSLVRLLQDEAGRGSQIVLHGLEHRRQAPLLGSAKKQMRGALFAGDAAEFLTLAPDAAVCAVRSGLSILADCALPAPDMFCPPGWLITDESLRALASSGVRRVTGMFSLYDLSGRSSRRYAGLGYMGAGRWQERGVSMLNAIVDGAWRPRTDAVRVFLHPQGAPTPALDAVFGRISALIARGWQPATFDEI